VWAPEMVPPTPLKVTGRPSSTPMFADTSVPAELVLKLAVRLEVWLTRMVPGLAGVLGCRKGVVESGPGALTDGKPVTVAGGGAAGPPPVVDRGNGPRVGTFGDGAAGAGGDVVDDAAEAHFPGAVAVEDAAAAAAGPVGCVAGDGHPRQRGRAPADDGAVHA